MNDRMGLNGVCATQQPRSAIHLESETGWAGHVRERRDWRDTMLALTWWGLRFAAGAWCAYGAWLLTIWLLRGVVR